MHNADTLQRFLFADYAVRGIFVHLNTSLQTIMQQHAYTHPITQYLAELLVANALLSADLKYKGTLTMQLHGQGSIRMLVSKCTHDLRIRGLANTASDVPAAALHADFAQGKLAVTLSADDNTQPYQSIIPINGNSIAHGIEHYFAQSEQLPTRLYIATAADCAAGLLLQQLPQPNHPDDWQHLLCLSNTLTTHELLYVETTTLLTRLFHQETITCFTPQPIAFGCSCSVKKMENSLMLLDKNEVYAELNNTPYLRITCEFCGQHHDISKDRVAQLFKLH